MPVTRKIGYPPLIMPSDVAAMAVASAGTTKAKAIGGPGPNYVRVHRGEVASGTGAEHIIRPAAPLALTP